jgi:nucleotide-binding universal stress UspA family protein
MTLQAQAAAAVGEWAEPHHPIVVAVDGSESNRSAVAWAAAEAAATGSDIVLLTAVEGHIRSAPHFSIRSQRLAAHDILADARHQVRQVVDQEAVRTEAVAGSPVEVILHRSGHARMVVVGKRGLGGFARVIVGSTSIAVARRAGMPVVVVPDGWKRGNHSHGPVVLGIDLRRPHHTPIHLAFSRARRFGVPLVAVHGWESAALHSCDDATACADAVSLWERETHAELDKILDLWRQRFPDVEVRPMRSYSPPAMAVVNAAEHAGLVVLGRHTEGGLGGFAPGSVTRAVLRGSQCPVMVVPTKGSS